MPANRSGASTPQHERCPRAMSFSVTGNASEVREPVSDYITVPEGAYRCRVAEVRVSETRAGDERWSLRLDATEGDYARRFAAWDALVFSARGRARARLVLRALGVDDLPGLSADRLIGREAMISIRRAEFEAPSGEIIRRNEVPYDGWRPLPAGGAR